MSLKSVVACLADPETAPAVAEAALRLAEEHEAHLTGLHVIPRLALYHMAGAEFPVEVIEQEEKARRKRAGEIEKLFAGAVKNASVPNDWRCEQSERTDMAPAFLEHVRWADLIVLRQDSRDSMDPDLAAEVVLEAGRPALIIPAAGDFTDIGKRVMIAWNGAREAARAAFDALPLLKKADSVSILSVNPEGDGGFSPGDDLAVALSRHGVRAETATSRADDISVGDNLLSRLADESCDLLVMGCYGRSRFRELLFGGVTRHILNHMTVPVLMSH